MSKYLCICYPHDLYERTLIVDKDSEAKAIAYAKETLEQGSMCKKVDVIQVASKRTFEVYEHTIKKVIQTSPANNLCRVCEKPVDVDKIVSGCHPECYDHMIRECAPYI